MRGFFVGIFKAKSKSNFKLNIQSALNLSLMNLVRSGDFAKGPIPDGNELLKRILAFVKPQTIQISKQVGVLLSRPSHVLDHRILLSQVEYLAFLLCNAKLAANLPNL